MRAVEEPLRMIAENAGHEGSIVVNNVKKSKSSVGFNAATEEYGDLIEFGVIDPTKVTRTALQNAVSVSSLLLTTEALIADRPDEKKDASNIPIGKNNIGGMGGMGGMGGY